MWRFKPLFKTTLWGGDKILSFKGWAPNSLAIGESWELSGVEEMESVVSSPRDHGLSISELIGKYGANLLGEKNFERFGNRFPLLIKFIDARLPLSIQVHPDLEAAQRMNIGSGKSEMWYVLSADPESEIIFGFDREMNAGELAGHAVSGEITKDVNHVAVKPDEAFFIPAGRVHGIGAGIFLLEIQEASDNTFRIYDYNRTDADGNKRELHIEKALEVARLDDVRPQALSFMELPSVPSVIYDSPFFTTKILRLQSQMMRNYSEVDSFVVIVCIGGNARLTTRNHEMEISRGETLLLSALEKEVMINPSEDFTAIEVFIR